MVQHSFKRKWQIVKENISKLLDKPFNPNWVAQWWNVSCPAYMPVHWWMVCQQASNSAGKCREWELGAQGVWWEWVM